jgi:hypothetical protein
MSLHNNIKKIVSELLSAEDRRLKQTILRLEGANSAVLNRTTDGFLLQGVYYRPDGRSGPPKTVKFPLAFELWDQGIAFLKDEAIVKHQTQLIRQALVNCLEPAYGTQDYRDALPECVISLMPMNLAGLSRTRPAGFTIAHDPIKSKQFDEAVPLMEVFSVGRMLY